MRKILFLLLMMCCSVGLTAQTKFKQLGETGEKTPSPSRTVLTGFTKQSIGLYKHNRAQIIKSAQRVKNANIPADKAEIILEAHDVLGYGTIGYQMLLDEKHNTYGKLFDGDSYEYDSNSYDAFKYKIPENAEALLDTEAVIVDGEGTVLIPEGTYDYMITCPFPNEGISFAKGEFGRFDDFYFKGGYTYRFIITLESGDMGMEDVAVPYTDVDAAVVAVTLPASSMNLTATETVSVKIANRGTSAISGFPICYQLNGGNPVQETYTGTIAAGATADYTFNTKADLSAEKLYTIKAYTSLAGDLIPYNDAKEGKCRHIGPAPLPYTYDFSSQEDFPFDWTVINANDDYCYWQYNDWDTHSGEPGAAYCPSYNPENDDYLLSSPILLESGDNHIIFYVKAASADMPELLDVRYGNTTNVESMTIIGDYTIKNNDWLLKAINFKVAQSGVYYFAFHLKTVDGASLYLDDILIDRGVYATNPDIAIEKILLPYSNCDLSDQSQIGVRLINNGTGPAESIDLTYTVNNKAPVKQTFAEGLEADATKSFYFDTPADFLDLGKYDVTVKAQTGNNADEQTASVEHYAPITEFPAVTDFYLNEGIEGNWAPMSENAWRYEAFGGCYSCVKGGVENGLLSRCFTFNRPFRVKIAYKGGLFYTPSALYIAYGKPGTDVSTWTKVYENKEISGEVETEFSVTPEEPGNYSIAIVDISEDANTLVSLYQLTVSEVYEHDIRITDAASPLAPYTPVNHVNKKGTYTIGVENRGTAQLTGVKVSVNKGATRLFTSEAVSTLGVSATNTLSAHGTLPAMKIGDSLADLSIKAEMNETDSYMEDNTWMLPEMHVTDTIFATEQTTEFIMGTGLSGQTAYFGNIYTLAETDTLTSLTVGLAQDDYYIPVNMGVAVYSLKADGKTIDKELYSKTFEREGKGGLRNISFTPRILEPGKYYFEVRQLSMNNIGLAYEPGGNSSFYQNVNGALYLMAGYGNIVVRANFGHNAKAYRKNVAVTEITKPVKTKALFSSVETVEAIVENTGMEAASGITVRCQTKGVDKTVTLDLESYSKKTVTFEGVDLSVPGEYTLTVSATVAGDENPGDNTVTRVLTSITEANPYSLDFESCDDFDTGREFNPRWWTVNRLGLPTNAWWQFDYPHNEEPVGFIAYNIEATTPPMTADFNVPGFFPHSGKRFGAAFVPAYISSDEIYASDTWLISPKLKLDTPSSLELYVKTHKLESRDSKLERYKLYVSDTDDNFDSFRLIGGEREAPEDWTKVTVDLSAYDHKEIYVALQYISRTIEGVVMMVDDILVKSGAVGIDNTENTADVQLSVTDGMLSVTSGSPIIGIRFYNISGQQLYDSGTIGTDYYRIPLTAYPAGVYMARVQTDKGTKTLKFVVK